MEDTKEAWASGNLMKPTEFQTAIVSANMQGRIALARELLDIEPAAFLVNED